MIQLPKTKRERARLYSKLYNRLAKELNGGCLFGMDWTTLTMLKPQITGAMRQIAIRDDY